VAAIARFGQFDRNDLAIRAVQPDGVIFLHLRDATILRFHAAVSQIELTGILSPVINKTVMCSASKKRID